MLDYNKMDEVLKNLDVSAKNLKSTSEVHEKLEKAEKDLKEALGELQKEREGLQASVDIMDEFGQDHKILREKVENVLADYKLLKSSYDFLEMELKKTNSNLEELDDKFEDMKTSFKLIEKGLEEVNGVCRRNGLLLNNIKTEQEDAKAKNKTLKSLAITGMLFAFGCLVMSVVGIFI